MSESNNQNTTQSKHEELTGVRAYALHNSFSGHDPWAKRDWFL